MSKLGALDLDSILTSRNEILFLFLYIGRVLGFLVE